METRQPELRVGVCQLTSSNRVDANSRDIERFLNGLDDIDELDLVCFPENALHMRIDESESSVSVALRDDALTRLSRWAVDHRVPIHLGSVPLLEQGQCFNASVLLTEDGEIAPVYRKIHLFDVDVVGQKRVRESDFFAHGRDPSILNLKGWKIGSSICYDIRFSELYSRYARAKVDAILIPAAFLTTTGQAHWSVLVRARAIESQAFVLAAAQGGRHQSDVGGQRETYGHSMIVDPWGQVLGEVRDDQNGPQCIRATLKAERIDSVRAQIPMSSHRTLT